MMLLGHDLCFGNRGFWFGVRGGCGGLFEAANAAGKDGHQRCEQERHDGQQHRPAGNLPRRRAQGQAHIAHDGVIEGDRGRVGERAVFCSDCRERLIVDREHGRSCNVGQLQRSVDEHAEGHPVLLQQRIDRQPRYPGCQARAVGVRSAL